MGSFYMTCRVTNSPITDGDRCVAIKVCPIETPSGRARYLDSIASPCYMTTMPKRGVYADYGHVDVDGGGTIGDTDEDTGTYMLFHEYAFDIMHEAFDREDAREKKFTDKYYAENGVPQYVIDREVGIFEALKFLEKDATSIDELDDVFAYMHLNALVHAPEGENAHKVFWQEALKTVESPRKLYEAYQEQLSWLFWARYAFGFQFRPSLYGGQEVEAWGIKRLAEVTASKMSEYAESADDYEEED